MQTWLSPLVLLQWLISLLLVRINSAALLWCFPSTGFLSLHAQWCNPEGTMDVMDDLCPGRTLLGWAGLGRAQWGEHRGTEKTQLWLFFLCLLALGVTAGRSIPTPWFAGEGFNSSWPCLCSDLHKKSVSALLMFPLGPSVLPTVTTSFLQWPSQYSFLLSTIGGKMDGRQTMKCVKMCVGEKEPFWGDQQGTIPRGDCAVILGHGNIAQGKYVPKAVTV